MPRRQNTIIENKRKHELELTQRTYQVRILRVLCSNGIFCEISPDVFANNRVSVALVQNEPLRAYMLHLSVALCCGQSLPATRLTSAE